MRDALLAAVETSVATLGPDVPPHLRDRITELASDSVRGWHAEAKHHLGGLLAGEQSCPEVERFAQLRLALLANPQLKQEPAVAGITKADSMEGGQEALIKVNASPLYLLRPCYFSSRHSDSLTLFSAVAAGCISAGWRHWGGTPIHG